MRADEVEVKKVLGDLAVANEDSTGARMCYLQVITRMFGGKMLSAGEEKGLAPPHSRKVSQISTSRLKSEPIWLTFWL